MNATAPIGTVSRGRILFADDDAEIRNQLGKYLCKMGYECDFAASADEAAECLRTRSHDVLLSDVNMPGNRELELIANAPAIVAGLPVILLTGNPTVETAVRSVNLWVVAYLTKPPDFKELCGLLDAAVAGRRELSILNDSRQRLQNWEQEIGRIQRVLEHSAPTDRQAAMQSYVRLTLRNLVVGLIDLEHLVRGWAPMRRWRNRNCIMPSARPWACSKRRRIISRARTWANCARNWKRCWRDLKWSSTARKNEGIFLKFSTSPPISRLT